MFIPLFAGWMYLQYIFLNDNYSYYVVLSIISLSGAALLLYHLLQRLLVKVPGAQKKASFIAAACFALERASY